MSNGLFDFNKRLSELGWTLEEFKEKIQQFNWWHTFYMDGYTIEGGDKGTQLKLEACKLPDLTSKTLIDVGAFDGFFTFECERLGATVTASDFKAWHDCGARDTFFFMHNFYGSRARIIEKTIEELGEQDGQYDIVLFLGVLYHAWDPLGYLKKMRQLTKQGGVCIVETHRDLLHMDIPAIAYYPNDTLSGDPTNYWGPNHSAMLGLLQDAGFNKVEFKGTWAEGYALNRKMDRAVYHAFVAGEHTNVDSSNIDT